jgi:uncharacterized protein (DUF1800 family)
MGRFRDLLGATAKHPAMLFYLDNWQNTAPNSLGARDKFEGINENYARELMELHTLGVNGGYSQTDVIALAHILTGWGLARGSGAMKRRASKGSAFWPPAFALYPFPFARWGGDSPPPKMDDKRASTNGFHFAPNRHDFSPQNFLGHRIAEGGLEQGKLRWIFSPAVRRRRPVSVISSRSISLPIIHRLIWASRYLATDGNLRVVLRSLFFSEEFWDPRHYAAKFKTPYQFVISATRAAGFPVVNDLPLAGAMSQLGMPLYGCQTPNGYRQTEDAWLSPDAMMMRLSFATALGIGRLPLQRPINEFAQGEGGRMHEGAISAGGDANPAGRHQPHA